MSGPERRTHLLQLAEAPRLRHIPECQPQQPVRAEVKRLGPQTEPRARATAAAREHDRQRAIGAAREV
jgi:hypothetical protein